jgi:hypothetical protein
MGGQSCHVVAGRLIVESPTSALAYAAFSTSFPPANIQQVWRALESAHIGTLISINPNPERLSRCKNGPEGNAPIGFGGVVGV